MRKPVRVSDPILKNPLSLNPLNNSSKHRRHNRSHSRSRSRSRKLSVSPDRALPRRQAPHLSHRTQMPTKTMWP